MIFLSRYTYNYNFLKLQIINVKLSLLQVQLNTKNIYFHIIINSYINVIKKKIGKLHKIYRFKIKVNT